MAGSIKVTISTGSKEDWDVWRFWFHAFCDACDMGQVIGSEQGVPGQSEQRDIRSWLALAMQSPVCVNGV